LSQFLKGSDLADKSRNYVQKNSFLQAFKRRRGRDQTLELGELKTKLEGVVPLFLSLFHACPLLGQLLGLHPLRGRVGVLAASSQLLINGLEGLTNLSQLLLP